MEHEQPALPQLPYAAPIDAYGNGGFRFAGMSHRGSLLCLPNAILASPIVAPSEISEDVLSLVFAQASNIDHLVIRTGARSAIVSEVLRQRLREHGIAVEAMSTGAAVRTYNILLGERRKIAALLIAVE